MHTHIYIYIYISIYSIKKHIFNISILTNISVVLHNLLQCVSTYIHILHIYFSEGYQQQQPIVITRCFMGFAQSSEDYAILFNL